MKRRYIIQHMLNGYPHKVFVEHDSDSITIPLKRAMALYGDYDISNYSMWIVTRPFYDAMRNKRIWAIAYVPADIMGEWASCFNQADVNLLKFDLVPDNGKPLPPKYIFQAYIQDGSPLPTGRNCQKTVRNGVECFKVYGEIEPV